MKNELTRRGAIRSAAAGITALGVSTGAVAAQDATPPAAADQLSPIELARLAGELRTALVPVIASLREQTEEKLTESATMYVEQLKEQKNVTEDEASTLQQILDATSSEGDDQTRIEKIQAIVDSLTKEEDGRDTSLVALLSIAGAMIRRADSSSDETPTDANGDTDFRHNLRVGIVGALAGAAIGGSIAGDAGTVIGAIAGALAAAI
jgi:hypothetical protein